MSYETNDIIYILCHTEDEIFVFTVANTPDAFKIDILREVNKAAKGLKINSIRAFGCSENTLVVINGNLGPGMVIITKDLVERREILDSDKKL
jgi:hypothetical protein